jgi:hypothetical protein
MVKLTALLLGLTQPLERQVHRKLAFGVRLADDA